MTKTAKIEISGAAAERIIGIVQRASGLEYLYRKVLLQTAEGALTHEENRTLRRAIDVEAQMLLGDLARSDLARLAEHPSVDETARRILKGASNAEALAEKLATNESKASALADKVMTNTGKAA